MSVEDQVKNAFDTIQNLLSSSSSSNTSASRASHTSTSTCAHQTQFARVNSIYRTLFGVSRPSRACVALPSLPPGCDLMINVIAFDDSDSPAFDRRALHVQGRSFWAPANIGPYSQSLVQAEKIWVAGQIGLVPADLSLPKEGEVQTALSNTACEEDLEGDSQRYGWEECGEGMGGGRAMLVG